MGRVVMRKALLNRSDLLRSLSSTPATTSLFRRHFQTGNGRDKSSESADDFERRLFGDIDKGANTDSFFHKLDRIERAHGRLDSNDNNSRYMEGLGGSFDSLDDGMDQRLEKAAQTFVHSDEIFEEDYSFRPDVYFREGATYTLRDLDLTKPGVQKNPPRYAFETTTAEVLKKADFRNVRFLSNFITESGIIIKRSQTKISAKAQRKVAREIKTARAFGLMPFTTMGMRPFVFGKNLKDDYEDYVYDSYDTKADASTAEPDNEPGDE